MKESILLVKSELQTNREDIAYIKELVELEQKGALYLLEYKGRIQEADPDSLQNMIDYPSKAFLLMQCTTHWKCSKLPASFPKSKQRTDCANFDRLRYSQEQPKRFRFIRQHKTALPGRVDESPRCQKKNEFHQLY